jgi:hypothetical protein
VGSGEIPADEGKFADGSGIRQPENRNAKQGQ